MNWRSARDRLIKERKTKPINLHSHKWMKKGWFGLFVFLSLTSIQSTIQKCFDCWWMKWRHERSETIQLNSISSSRAAGEEKWNCVDGLAAQRGCLVGRSVHFVMPHLLFLHEFHSFHKNKLLSSSISLHYFLIPSQSIHQLSRNARLLSFFNKKSKQSDGIDWGNQWNQSLRGRGALAPITHNNSFFIVAEESYAPPIQQFKKSTTFLQWRRKSWWFIDCWWLRPTSPLNRRAKPGWKVIQLRLHRPFNKETIQLIKEI